MEKGSIMSIVAAVDGDIEWVVLTDSAVNYRGIIEIEPQAKGYVMGRDFGMWPVGSFNESRMWKRAVEELHSSGGPKASVPIDIVWEIIRKAKEIGSGLMEEFEPKQRMFMKVSNHLFYLNGAYISAIHEKYMAIGSGRKFFYGAMDASGSAVKAMKSACRRDPYCAKPIVEYHINKTTGEVQRFE